MSASSEAASSEAASSEAAPSEAAPSGSTPSDDAGLPVVPPRVVQAIAPTYPSDTVQQSRVVVVLEVTVDAEGFVSSAIVQQSAGAAFDAAALTAVKQWVFEPARRGDKKSAARISLPVAFDPPLVEVTEPVPAGPTVDSSLPAGTEREPEVAPDVPPEVSRAETQEPPSAPATTEVVVEGEQRAGSELRSASDYLLESDILHAAPHHEGVDMLRATPGLYIGRPEGTAVAHRYMLRGFDSDHGQDIEFRVGGVPINLPSHIHGQGYADLGLLIGDAVDELRVTEGVHDPRQGDFAVAGTIDVRLGVEERGIKLRTAYGSFGSFRQLALWAPQGQLRDTFGAVEFHHTEGYGDNRAGSRGSALLQQGFSLADWRVRLLGIFYGARSGLAGVLRQDDIDNERIGFFDAYDHPTARAQNALAMRGIIGVFGEYRGLYGDLGEAGLWMSADRFRIQQNLTGFVERSRTLSGVAGQGDLIEQRNGTTSVGALARYRTAAMDIGSVHSHIEFGTTARFDAIEQEQNLLNAVVRGQTWDQRVDAAITALDVGLWTDFDLHLTRWLELRLGYRADLLGYEIDDVLGNRAPATRSSDSYIVGFRRSTMGFVHGPRVSVDITPWGPLTLHASYGEGYRSPQARQLADGETAPFTKVRSADLGARYSPSEALNLSLSAYQTGLSDDVAFDAGEGRLERVGATRRRGGVVHVEARPWPGSVAAASLTYVDAELLEPPPATAEEPNPPFQAGQNLPFVPALVARVDLGVERELARVADELLRGRVGVGFSALSARPLPFGAFARPFALVDVSLAISLSRFTVGFEMFNVMDARYSSAEYSYVSHWDPEQPPSRLPVRHVSAGAPRTVMGSLELAL